MGKIIIHILIMLCLLFLSISFAFSVNLLAGSIITEKIFSWPGVGQEVIEAIQRRDYPLVQAGVFFISIFLITLNLIVDLLFGFIDPRIRVNK